MTVHSLLEVTAKQGQLDAIKKATQGFIHDIQQREEKTRSVQAFTLQGTRSVLIQLTFNDQLAAHDHRQAPHTGRFTEQIQPHAEHVDLHELDPLEPVSPQPE